MADPAVQTVHAALGWLAAVQTVHTGLTALGWLAAFQTLHTGLTALGWLAAVQTARCTVLTCSCPNCARYAGLTCSCPNCAHWADLQLSKLHAALGCLAAVQTVHAALGWLADAVLQLKTGFMGEGHIYTLLLVSWERVTYIHYYWFHGRGSHIRYYCIIFHLTESCTLLSVYCMKMQASLFRNKLSCSHIYV